MRLLNKKNSTKKSSAQRRRDSNHRRYSPGSTYTKLDNQYRRGRTIAASGFMQKNAASDKIHGSPSPREKVRKLNNIRRKVMTFLGVLGLLTITLAGLIWSFTASVVVTFSNSDRLPDKKVYEKTIQEYLTKNPTERLRFNLNDSHLTEFVTKAHAEVSSVKQEGFAGFASSNFSIELRRPVVSWQVGRSLYFVDKDGVSFSRNVFDNPSVKIVDNSGVQHTSGTAIASARFLGFVGKSVALAQDNNLNVTHAVIPAGTSRQVELSVRGVPYPFILSIDRSSAEQIEDVMRSINYFGRSGRSPQYVDVRVKGKAFFRERE
ncbi:hypothetical protein GX865_00565 [Candidatus Saccharibacteria bacterium]|jgi:hypothetical protein|nr:hypothetical protein [Candidatus Saccharibacteria bacterium]